MKGRLVPCPLCLFTAITFLHAAVATADPSPPANPPGGGFLYAGDDDWDWASPLGVAEPSGLSKYGAMPWSALDWAEEGLARVRGALVGTPPNVGGYMTMEALEKIRGEQTTYAHYEQSDEGILDLLASDHPPNVIILMQDTGKGGQFGPGAVGALADFVKGGGRLLVLDDWQHHVPLFERLVEAALALPKSPAPPILPEAPAEDGFLDDAFVARVDSLVSDLGSKDFPTRENAMAALRSMGLPAIDLADELRGDDPEVAVRLARIREELDPKPQDRGEPGGSEEQKRKHEEAAERVTAAAAKLDRAGIPHHVADVFVNNKSLPLPSLRVRFPAPEK